ncbi:hypothetical protein BV898_00072 [Hypsibius exemplaris]|jgi:hypothetical protein|uniref:Single domain-containing protein n=1 Tax=Hypsibius exemplaris TaxID=2072580 RepID=A0A1W0XEL7_HYPEX|nr:hypothetical protein BV898_00072 [Hypsibius exemplaris]
MKFLLSFILLGVFLLCRGLPLDNTVADSEANSEAEESLSEDGEGNREKRSIFPYVLGETILDIQCRRGSLTVCAPDGPSGCPVGYSSQTNVGVCGFATLNHYLNTSNIAGTCCYKTAGTAVGTVTTTTTGRSVLLPQIVAYPVYAQYPYAVASNTAAGSSAGSSSGK